MGIRSESCQCVCVCVCLNEDNIHAEQRESLHEHQQYTLNPSEIKDPYSTIRYTTKTHNPRGI